MRPTISIGRECIGPTFRIYHTSGRHRTQARQPIQPETTAVAGIRGCLLVHLAILTADASATMILARFRAASTSASLESVIQR